MAMASDAAAKMAANVATWNERASSWRARDLPNRNYVGALAVQLGCPTGSLVLDLGCGAGLWSVALAQEGYRLRGVDPAPKMVAEAEDFAMLHGLSAEQVSFGVGDAEHIPADEAAFDGVVCLAVLDFVPHPGAALQEIWRVLRPSGRLVLAVLGAASPVKRASWRRFLPGSEEADIFNHILPWEMEAVLKELGWQLLEQQPFFGSTASGVTNAYTMETAERLVDPILQQTVATAWMFVARKPVQGEVEVPIEGHTPEQAS